MAHVTEGGLIIPESVTDMAPPKYHCAICGADFTEGQEDRYARHVAQCAKKNADTLRAMSLREKAPGIFHPDSWDREHHVWLKQHPGSW